MKGSEPSKRGDYFFLWVVLGLCILVAGGAGWWWTSQGRYRVKQIRFEPVAWKQADPRREATNDHRTIRSHMIKDLLKRHDFHGWTRSQLFNLLGEPDGPWSGFEQWDIIYVLGMERQGAWSLDDEALGFKLDTTGQVIKYGLSVN